MDLLLPERDVNKRRMWLLRSINTSDSLPPFPKVLVALNRVLKDPDASTHEVVQLLEIDPVIAGRVLSLANSAYYSAGRQQVHTLTMAVNRLGITNIRSLVFSAILPGLFAGEKYVDHFQFWRHGLTVALLAREWIMFSLDKKNKDLAEDAYLAGLMHDIGILVYTTILKEKYTKAITADEYKGEPLYAVEELVFGVNHAELGAIYVESVWNIPHAIVDGIGKHHIRPSYEDSMTAIQTAVFVANTICSIYDISAGIKDRIQHEHLEMFQEIIDLGVEMEEMDILISFANRAVKIVESVLLRPTQNEKATT